MEQSLRILPVSMPLRIVTYDIDFAGVVSNIVYIRWLEDLRLRFMEVHYPLEQAIKERSVPLISKTQAHYLKPLRLFDQPNGFVWIKRLDRVRFVLGAEIQKDGQKVFEATQEGCFVNLETKTPVRIPKELQGLSLAYIEGLNGPANSIEHPKFKTGIQKNDEGTAC
jgi:acyl-CoA thioester hydrolase